MIYDTIIIGAGTAGMTAALYCLRAGKNVLLLESVTFGGQILQTPLIENYPALTNVSGNDFSNNLHSQLKDLGFKITYQEAVNISLKQPSHHYQVQTNQKTFLAKTIILATGTISRKLSLPHEEQLIGKGIAFCATCDGPLYQNQPVAVVGGGNSAVLSALHLSDLCSDVFLIHRRAVLRAEELLIRKLLARPNIHIIYSNQVTSLHQFSGQLSGISLLKPLTPKISSSDFSFNNSIKNTLDIKKIPTTLSSFYNSTENILNIKALFVEIGRIFPSQDLLQELVLEHHLQTDPFGFVKTDSNCKTNLAGFFAAGDCRAKDLRQLVTATADGALAATSVVNFV